MAYNWSFLLIWQSVVSSNKIIDSHMFRFWLPVAILFVLPWLDRQSIKSVNKYIIINDETETSAGQQSLGEAAELFSHLLLKA